MSQPDGVVFVYRSHYEGLLSKRVRRLPDHTVLDWFRRGWAAASDPATDLDVWVATELGGRVYGLATIFDAARKRELPAPATANELGAALAEHLYVEGEAVVEDGRVLTLTDDDEVELACFFLPCWRAGRHPSGWLTCCTRISRCPARSVRRPAPSLSRSRRARWHRRAAARASRTRCCSPSTTATASAGCRR